MSELQQMIIVRKDLNMRKGKMIAQSCHACLGLYIHMQDSTRIKEWLRGKFTKIAVSVDSLDELYEVTDKAREAGINSFIIQDAGLTEFNRVKTITCAALEPATKEELADITGGLKLL